MIPTPPNANDNIAQKTDKSLNGAEPQPNFFIRTMQQDLKAARAAGPVPAPSASFSAAASESFKLSGINENTFSKSSDSKLSPPPLPEKIRSEIPHVSVTKSKDSPNSELPAAGRENNFSKNLQEKNEQIRQLANNTLDSPEPEKTASDINIPASNETEIANLKSGKKNKKLILIISAIILALALISPGIYFSFPYVKKTFIKPPSIPKNPIPPVEDPIENPKIITNKFKLLEFSSEYDFNILSSLYIDQFKTNIKSVLIDKIDSNDIAIPETGFLSVQMSVDGKFLEGEDVIDGLAKNFPPAVLDKIDRKNNLLLYSQNKEPRMGLIFQLISNEDLVVWLRQWENTMAEDLKNLFMDNLGDGISTMGIFQDTIYKGVPIRYLNLSSHSTAIDYAIVDNMLIITTSKESMFGLIDYIKEKTYENYLIKSAEILKTLGAETPEEAVKKFGEAIAKNDNEAALKMVDGGSENQSIKEFLNFWDDSERQKTAEEFLNAKKIGQSPNGGMVTFEITMEVLTSKKGETEKKTVHFYVEKLSTEKWVIMDL